MLVHHWTASHVPALEATAVLLHHYSRAINMSEYTDYQLVAPICIKIIMPYGYNIWFCHVILLSSRTKGKLNWAKQADCRIGLKASQSSSSGKRQWPPNRSFPEYFFHAPAISVQEVCCGRWLLLFPKNIWPISCDHLSMKSITGQLMLITTTGFNLPFNYC